MEKLNFAMAYAAMKLGAKVHRVGHKEYWGFDSNKGEYIYLPDKDKEISYGKLELTIKECANNDWEIIGESIDLPEITSDGLSFADAYKAMKAGSKIRRKGFKGHWGITDETGEIYIMLPDGKVITYGKLGQTMRSCAANDWEIL